ncbi:uncharacterized protein I303_108514 [Kwoniella dejecticola CBS 10117]|uniref:Uncharacterized protein n=1 Tax=Kwoniella dejecticola CBS 10117 TaxID=1296121 RepID=A0A1A5ZX67_9TREE|nr:uncharacterized protein I303_07162 [Kwoniella dejecticola CBS 10117]OBR82403.1 hypothetical protein I303_07162 [Kwoniella dejecticola CBS 10117]
MHKLLFGSRPKSGSEARYSLLPTHEDSGAHVTTYGTIAGASDSASQQTADPNEKVFSFLKQSNNEPSTTYASSLKDIGIFDEPYEVTVLAEELQLCKWRARRRDDLGVNPKSLTTAALEHGIYVDMSPPTSLLSGYAVNASTGRVDGLETAVDETRYVQLSHLVDKHSKADLVAGDWLSKVDSLTFWVEPVSDTGDALSWADHAYLVEMTPQEQASYGGGPLTMSFRNRISTGTRIFSRSSGQTIAKADIQLIAIDETPCTDDPSTEYPEHFIPVQNAFGTKKRVGTTASLRIDISEPPQKGSEAFGEDIHVG